MPEKFLKSKERSSNEFLNRMEILIKIQQYLTLLDNSTEFVGYI